MDAETPFADVRVMEQHDSPSRELRPPGLEVVPHGVVRVQPVDVEQVDRTFLEVSDRVVEGRSDEARELGVMPLVVHGESLEDLLAVEPGVLVPFPRVDCVARRWDSQPCHRLTQREV